MALVLNHHTLDSYLDYLKQVRESSAAVNVLFLWLAPAKDSAIIAYM